MAAGSPATVEDDAVVSHLWDGFASMLVFEEQVGGAALPAL